MLGTNWLTSSDCSWLPNVVCKLGANPERILVFSRTLIDSKFHFMGNFGLFWIVSVRFSFFFFFFFFFFFKLGYAAKMLLIKYVIN